MAGVCVVVSLAGLLFLFSADDAVSAPQYFTRAKSPVSIDGRLDEPAWAEAIPDTRFFEIYPANAGVPQVRTEARFLFDDRYVYIGVRAYDPNPGAIRSGLVRRDEVLDDQDYIEVLIDSVNGRHNALLFRTNAQGIPTDGQFSEETQMRDYTVDLNFDVAATIDSLGWTAEFRIPLATFRYQTGQDQAWTVEIFRNLPRAKTVTIASVPIARKANCTLCYGEKIGGLSLAPAKDPLTFTPYVTVAHDTSNNAGIGTAHNLVRSGFDIKWQPAPDTAVDLTVFPDFSQVEADDLQLTANTRFALSVKEKRPFFLEGADLLSTATTGINAIYTRSFTAPDAGARVTRRGDDYEYSALVLRDTGGGSIVEPGPITSQLGPQDFTSTAFVGRYLLHDEPVTWGALATARFNDGGGRNLVYGGDMSWTPTSTDHVFAQLLESQTENPDRPDLLAEWTGQKLAGAAGAVTWTHSANDWYSTLYLRSYAPGFRAWNGFEPQVGVAYATLEAGLNFYPRDSLLVRVSPLIEAYYSEEIDGGELGKYAAPGILLEGPGNTSLGLYWYRHVEQITLAGLRSYNYVYLSLLSSPAAWLPQMMVTASIGDGLDATTGEVGDGLIVQATTPIRLFNRLEIRPSLGYQSLNSRRAGLAQKRLVSEIDTQADVLWYFSKRLYLEALYQSSKSLAAAASTPPLTEPQSRSTLTSLLLSYQTNWQTRYYLGMRRGTSQLQGTSSLQSNQTEIFAKLSYAFFN
jgi:hypothetical protein